MNNRILLCVDSYAGADAKQYYYMEAVEAAGCTAVAAYCPTLSLDYDGLLLCGGCDLDPAYYGEEINGSVDVDPERDRAEFALLDAYVKAGKPVMGICRGFQLLNVYFGGTLHQHLKNANIHRGSLDHYPVHDVIAAHGSILEQLYADRFFVNSCHHQGIKDLGKNLTPIAWHDNLIEGITHDHLPILGVQWHPEKQCCRMYREDAVDGLPIFSYFLSLIK